MAGLRHHLRKWYEAISDWVWPQLFGEPTPSPERQLSIETTDAALLSQVEHVLDKRMNQAHERLRAIETKLLALLTLTSVLSTAVTATFVVVSTMDTLKDFSPILVWFLLAIVFYIALNLLRSLWATVSGLTRRGFKVLHWEDVIPIDEEDSIRYKSRILNQWLNHLEWNERVCDEKVSEMAVAYMALRNALVGAGAVLVIALVGAVIEIA